MLKLFHKSGLPAIAGLLVLSAGGACFGAAVTIDGGTSAVVDGWMIAPDPGLTLQADTDAGSGSLVITKTASFESNAPLNIQFTEAGLNESPIEFSTESITNSTGTDWTGFTFSLTSPATFLRIFIQPVGAGVDYTAASLNPQMTIANYTGLQVNGSTSAWGGTAVNDELLISAPLAPLSTPTVFTFTETPVGAPSAVPLPIAAGQVSATLLGLGLIAAARKVKASKAQVNSRGRA